MCPLPERNSPDIEELIKMFFFKQRVQIEKVSSELQISATPKFCQDKNGNFYMDSIEKGEYVLTWKRKKLPFHVIFALACQSWWYPEDIRAAVQFLILEERKRWNLCHEELDIVLSSKALCLLYLQEKVAVHSLGWLYGSIITTNWQHRHKTGKELTYSLYDVLPIYRYYEKKKPKKSQRIRGYRDHGSLGDLSNRARREEWRRDQQSSQMEEELLKKEKESEDFRLFLEGWLS